MNVGLHAAIGNDGVIHQLVQFVVSTNGQGQMARRDTAFLIVPRSISSQLQNFCHEILQNSCKVHRCPCPNTGCNTFVTHKSSDSTNWKVQARSRGSGMCRALRLGAAFCLDLPGRLFPSCGNSRRCGARRWGCAARGHWRTRLSLRVAHGV